MVRGNVYKPPPTQLQYSDLLVSPQLGKQFQHVATLIGITTITVRTVSALLVGQVLPSYTMLRIQFNFNSGCWNADSNPNLVFAKVGLNSRLPDRRVLEKFSRSQHRPLLITQLSFALWAACSSDQSAVLMINMVSVQNLLASFCCVFERDILWHFPCLVVLASSSKLKSYLFFLSLYLSF